MILGQIAEPFHLFVQITAGLGGAIVGFLLSGPVMRLLYRLAFQRPVPGWLLPWCKLGGALVCGLLLFLLVERFGGGWGLGPGGGPGTVGIPGAGKTGDDKGKTAQGKNGGPRREKLEIELLGGGRVGADARYYLVKREPPAKTLLEVEELLKDKADKLEVHVVVTDESVALSHPAMTRLRELLQRLQIPTLTPPEEP